MAGAGSHAGKYRIYTAVRMFYVICFDVRDERRLVKISETLENFGCRVQKSLFECYLGETELKALDEKLAGLLDPAEDQIRYYTLCSKDKSGILVDGDGEVTREHDFFLY